MANFTYCFGSVLRRVFQARGVCGAEQEFSDNDLITRRQQPKKQIGRGHRKREALVRAVARDTAPIPPIRRRYVRILLNDPIGP
jgi:hypothetical protein